MNELEYIREITEYLHAMVPAIVKNGTTQPISNKTGKITLPTNVPIRPVVIISPMAKDLKYKLKYITFRV